MFDFAVTQCQAVSTSQLPGREEFTVTFDELGRLRRQGAIGVRVCLEPELGELGVVVFLRGAEG